MSPSSTFFFFLFFLLLLLLAVLSVAHQPLEYPTTANLSTIWTNNSTSLPNFTFPDGSLIRPILLHRILSPTFGCGFYCAAPCNSFLFAVFAVYPTKTYPLVLDPLYIPHVVWSANRDRAVHENSSVEFNQEGILVLSDSDSAPVWSTGNLSMSVVAMQLMNSGNLVLVDKNHKFVWESFDYPTDTLLIGQSLREGQRLTANTSITNCTGGRFHLTVQNGSLAAYIDSNPPQRYFGYKINGAKVQDNSTFITFINGSLAAFASDPIAWLPNVLPASLQFIRLDREGHLRLYEWRLGCKMLGDVLSSFLSDCDYPTVCGEYGICSKGQCSCPIGNDARLGEYFKPVDELEVNLGCSPTTPLSCQLVENHSLIALANVSYFNYVDAGAAVVGLKDEHSCKQACLMDCACKAAFFQYRSNSSLGSCFIPTQLFSMMGNQPYTSLYNSSAFIKFHAAPTASTASSANHRKKSSGVVMAVGSILGGLFITISVIALVIIVSRRKITPEDVEEDYHFQQVQGMPMRFSFQDLRLATENFCKKLGEGGFGSVYEGVLQDGTKVAVKRLDGVSQGKKEFLAEVETTGSIHHINLMRLIGFCAEKSYRLLVYEYMSNGSLDNWIFRRNPDTLLDWGTRFKIIIDVAKGLSYLHEECRQRIAHLDIKPQNILLDDTFVAKVSDFGLAKLIDRDKSHVMTKMRGTPGYLAPEWLTSKITEKVDVYSFGVLVMEITCGRRNLDYSKPEEEAHLVSLLTKLVESDKLMSIVESSADMQLFSSEVAEMMRLAMWCLQSDANRRPSMSNVVKVLEGGMEVETNLNYDFSFNPLTSRDENVSALQLASVLSGPR